MITFACLRELPGCTEEEKERGRDTWPGILFAWGFLEDDGPWAPGGRCPVCADAGLCGSQTCPSFPVCVSWIEPRPRLKHPLPPASPRSLACPFQIFLDAPPPPRR